LHVELSNVTKVYEDPPQIVTALKDISFHVNEGEFLCIVGPSGCGKSTLLRMIAGLDRPSSGQIRFRVISLQRLIRRLVWFFQTFALLPWRTVIQNVEFGLEVQGRPKKERAEVAMDLLEMVGLKGQRIFFQNNSRAE